MPVSRGFQDFILDLLGPLHPMPRRMFSGVGLFNGGVMFGLLVRDAFYLRVDEVTRERFERAGSAPFSYLRGERQVSLSAYYAVPEDLLDRQDELLQWARGAMEAARAAHRPRSSALPQASNARSATSRSGARRYRKKPTSDNG
jgi:DNA transformation protein